nr:uncharacterized protein LOC125423306 [Ziziphus jujuba var. spinosa]
MTLNEKLHNDDSAEKVDAKNYRSLVGCLIYLTNTRPDIVFAVSYVPDSCMSQVKITTLQQKESFAIYKMTAKAPQDIYSATDAASEAVWFRTILSGMQHEDTAPTIIRCDNMSAIAMIKNPVFHSRTKHIEI